MPAMSVVDDTITSPVLFEFFLQSHTPIQVRDERMKGIFRVHTHKLVTPGHGEGDEVHRTEGRRGHEFRRDAIPHGSTLLRTPGETLAHHALILDRENSLNSSVIITILRSQLTRSRFPSQSTRAM